IRGGLEHAFSSEKRDQCFADIILCGLWKVAMHGKAEDFLTKTLRDSNAFRVCGELPVGFLLVQRARIIDHGGNALLLELCSDLVASFKFNGILRPNRFDFRLDKRNGHVIAESL